MARLWIMLLLNVAIIMVTMQAASSDDDEKVYIVYLGSLPQNSSCSQHMEMLQDIKGSKAAASLVYSYHRSFNGFAAKLNIAEMEHLSAREGVVSVFESKAHMTQTTRSWDFMGFNVGVQRSQAESDVIVGVIDSGIWPESESFRDDNFGPPPAKWAGICQGGDNFTCNNKVIGARFYNKLGDIDITTEFISPRDSNGHGTHTASIVAGGVVEEASLFGIGSGSARGGVPSARLAIYKACWNGTICNSANLLAAFDDAISDGVDIISISVVGRHPVNYFEDPISIGSFHAYQRGILTSAAAGNDGPRFGTIGNTAPWALSVAAATIDRRFFTPVKLGDGDSLEGFPANTFDDQSSLMELVQLSCPSSLGASTVQNKIVLCRFDPSDFKDNKTVSFDDIMRILYENGAQGALTPRGDREEAQKGADGFPLPGTSLRAEDASQAFLYINSTSHPTALISKTIQGKDPSAPLVPDFSSRGPNPSDPAILKPDIAAPGVNILAAWSAVAPLTPIKGDDRRTRFNIDSGTSMACPHVSAIAAYIKSFQPTWSPSMVTSALLTTAWPMRPEDNFGAELAYGAGFVNPMAALDPGLVYDNSAKDFIDFLCNSGYQTGLLQLVTGDNTTCDDSSTKRVSDLNYPSFTVYTSDGTVSANFSRVATCVGEPSTYEARVEAVDGLFIRVEPNILYFNSSGDRQSFEVFINGSLAGSPISSSHLIWSDGIHFVRSPIVVHSIRGI